MSFFPLPRIFLTDLESRTDRPVVELGCGDGRFGAVIADVGARVIGIDRRPPSCGTAADLVGDVVDPPLSPGSVPVLVAANLLRHLAFDRPEAVPGSWIGLLRPGGVLWIFEDEPGDATPGAANYKDLQSWLARLVPGRSPLLSLTSFRDGFAPGADDGWSFGLAANEYPASVDGALAVLEPDFGDVEGEAGRLADRIRAHGLSYGQYWWARYAPGESRRI